MATRDVKISLETNRNFYAGLLLGVVTVQTFSNHLSLDVKGESLRKWYYTKVARNSCCGNVVSTIDVIWVETEVVHSTFALIFILRIKRTRIKKKSPFCWSIAFILFSKKLPTIYFILIGIFITKIAPCCVHYSKLYVKPGKSIRRQKRISLHDGVKYFFRD